MALDPIQQSPFVYYPQVAATGGDIGKSFSSGYTAEQQHAANALAMDAARQQEVMNQQAMRLKEAEEARKQTLFKQGMANTARVNAAYAGSAAPTLEGGPVPSGAGMKAPAAPAAPAAPGPQAEYNPQADIPSANAIPAQAAGVANAPGGFAIPGGYHVPVATGPAVNALPTFAAGPITAPTTTDSRMGMPLSRYSLSVTNGMPMTAAPITPAPTAAPTPAGPPPNPYGEINPNAPQFVQHLQGGLRGLNTEAAFRMINRQLGGGMLPDGTAVSNYFFGSPQNAAAMQTQSEARTWYDSPQVQTALRSNPQLLVQAERDPLGFYQANKGSIQSAPAAAPAAASAPPPIVVEGADGKPVTIGGQPTPNAAAGYAPERGLRTPEKAPSVTETIMSAPPGAPAPTPDTNQYLLEPAMIGVQQKQIQDQFKTLQAMWTRAQKLHDNATMTNVELKMMELRSGHDLLNGVKAITEFSAGRPEMLAATLNKMSGGSFMLQPRADGKFNVYSGDTLTGEGVTKEELTSKARMIFDQQFQSQVQAGIAANKARADKLFEAQIKGLEEAFKQEAIQNKDINVETVKARLKREFPETDYTHVPSQDGRGVFLYDKKQNKAVAFMSIVQEIGVDGKPVLNADKTPRMVPQIVKTQ